MKRFNITEEEKKDILNIYQTKKILNEQRFKLPSLSNLFGSSAKNTPPKTQFTNFLNIFGSSGDDIAKNFSDDGARNIDAVLGKILSSKENFGTNKYGVRFVKSLSGNWIEMSQIEKAIKSAADGKIENLDLLPRKLADGTEFRSIVTTAVEQKTSQNVGKVAQTSSKLPLSQIGNDFKELASNYNGWIPITNQKGNLSGWKFHIYADDIDEVAYIYEKILPIVKQYGAGFKAASPAMLERLATNAVQKGKGVTLYLPSEVVANNRQRTFLSDIQNALKGYNKSGEISGDRMITKNIGYRYELSKPIDASKGVNMNEYQSLYKSNEGGGHNIQGNPDLFR
jgi:hypothetical protein